MKILGIESSCDETAAAVVEDGRKLLSSSIYTQIDEHKLYGGVVPEIASRRHCETICEVTQNALQEAGLTLEEVDAVAVTYAPGLVGALLVGVNYAKGLSFAAEKPLIPVHHLRGHIAANYLVFADLKPPFLCLIVSGGHTHLVQVEGYTKLQVIGRTQDDAAGEAFDKTARTLGYPYPGGGSIDRAAKQGDPTAYPLPHPKTRGAFDFSFSGLKTAVMNVVHNAEQRGETVNQADMAASFQQVVCELLVERLLAAAHKTDSKTVVLAGGVCANSQLREMAKQACEKSGYTIFMPPLSLCGDNAAMIASQAFYEFEAGHVAGLDLNAVSSLSIEEDAYGAGVSYVSSSL